MAKEAYSYLSLDPWAIREVGFHKDRNKVSESLFCIANEYMGIRGVFEEGTSLPTLRGSYFNGVCCRHGSLCTYRNRKEWCKQFNL